MAAFDKWLRIHELERYAREQLEEAKKGNDLTTHLAIYLESLPEAFTVDPAFDMHNVKVPVGPVPCVPDLRASLGSPARWLCTMKDCLFQR